MIVRTCFYSALILTLTLALAAACGDSGGTASDASDVWSDAGGTDTQHDDSDDNDHGHESDLAADACEHMQDGPAQAFNATADPAGAPDATVEHMRADVTLVDGDDGHTGYVTFTVEEGGDIAFFLNQTPGFELMDDTGATIAPEETWESVDDCEEVFEGHLYELAEGQTVTLAFGPTSLSTVSFVPVHAGEDAHE